MQQTHDTLSHNEIFMRTRSGCAMAIKQNNRLSAHANQMLLIVNGYTPLKDLLSMLGEDIHQRVAAVEELLSQELIEQFKVSKSTNKSKWFGKQIGFSEPYRSNVR